MFKYGFKTRLDSVNVIQQLEYGQRKVHAPRVVQQQQFEYAYLFGAVCVTTGEAEAIVVPLSNMEAMKEQLRLISQATQVGKHAVVIMNQASWHQSYLADEFENLTVIHILPYSPEFNPIEQLWSWLRKIK
ncbi:hypothetical protein DS893_04815 [Vibrionales bacterium C3R12]|nr:hypothetical protein DS893_04815 [Vibrionales bacterium C3R12]